MSLVVLDVDEVLDRPVDAVVPLDVEATFAVRLSVLLPTPLLLLLLGAGTSISCTLTSVLDLVLTAPSLLAEVDLDAESTTDFAALLTDDDGAPFNCRLAASCVLLAISGLLAFFWSSEGISISWSVAGARALVRLREGDDDSDSSTLSRTSLPTLFSVVVRCSDDDDDISPTFPGDVFCIESVLALAAVAAAAETTALAAAAAAA